MPGADQRLLRHLGAKPPAQPKPVPELVVEFTDRGVSNVPVYFSEKATNHLIIRGNMEDFPDHVRVQFRQRREAIREVLHHYFKRAVNSDRFNLEIDLRLHGFADAADFLRSDRMTR